jgi:uncharacterized LabA/DUF88 family protein
VATKPLNTNVYVDGFNLYYGAIRGTKYKWLDLSKLCKILLPRDNVASIKYFTAKVSGRSGNPDSPIRQQLYLRALCTLPNVSIVYGQFLTHSVPMPVSKTNPRRWVNVDKTEEKGSDVNLATYLLHDGFRGLYDVAVIISNDSDLREPVKIVREVLHLPVGIVNPHEHHSRELQEYATFVNRIRE